MLDDDEVDEVVLDDNDVTDEVMVVDVLLLLVEVDEVDIIVHKVELELDDY